MPLFKYSVILLLHWKKETSKPRGFVLEAALRFCRFFFKNSEENNSLAFIDFLFYIFFPFQNKSAEDIFLLAPAQSATFPHPPQLVMNILLF